jgi:nitrite reductase/ring-hydroxylating ferredoxin subunit
MWRRSGFACAAREGQDEPRPVWDSPWWRSPDISADIWSSSDASASITPTCAHLGGPLSEGQVDDVSIRCPWHGSRFGLADGQILEGPSTFTQPAFETRVRDGRIEVRPRRK